MKHECYHIAVYMEMPQKVERGAPKSSYFTRERIFAA